MSPNISLISSKQFKIALVAGESSGDKLGGPLINSLKTHFPKAQFIGVGGPHMIKEGLDSIFSLDRISVMGFIEVIKHLPKLLRIMRKTVDTIKNIRPDRIILVDYPGFNLRLAKKVKILEIPVTYFILPQVWAWKEKRIRIMKKTIDQSISIFPFDFCDNQ